MHIRCPNCHNAIEIAPDVTADVSRCPSCGSVLSVLDETEAYRPLEAKRVEHFELLEHVGQGHFGDVWRARDTQLQRTVAVKIPRTRHLDSATKALFLREARAAAQLRHPNIVPVHEVGSVDDTLYIVSDFVEGVNLAERIKERRFAPRDAAELCAVIAEAMHHAHQAGVIHRDLKPGNLLLDMADQPHITDFGLAKREGAEITMTVQGQVLGTPAYMSPEQARGDAHDADARSDVYSLGVIFYELLAGQRPFASRDRGALKHQVLHDEPAPPHRWDKSVPRDLETICLKALHKEPARRYPTAQELADDLRRYLAGRPITARRVSRWERGWRWARRNPALSTASTVAALSLASLAIMFMVPPQGPPTRNVTLSTTPAGANVVFIPLDRRTGMPQPLGKVRARGQQPARARLLPGDYLVVAYVDTQQFHEVYRHVPDFSDKMADNPYPHRLWKERDGTIELPPISIPTPTVSDGMALVRGGEFSMGSAENDLPPRHQRRVPDYYLDVTETTFGQFRRFNPHWTPNKGCLEVAPAEDYPLTCIGYDYAMYYAEVIGKRLPDETEYEFAATYRGTRAYPWGADAGLLAAWPLGPVGAVAIDQVDLDPQQPIRGLCSNAAEWTSSWPANYPPNAALGLVEPANVAQLRVVRGGGLPAIEGHPGANPRVASPRYRYSCIRQTWKPGLGIRCARSVKPRLEPEDFVSLTP